MKKILDFAKAVIAFLKKQLNVFLDFLQRWFTGYWTFPILGKYVSIPKLAPLFTYAFIVTYVGDVYHLGIVKYLGFILLTISVFCFYMLRILKKRQFNGLTKQN